MKKNHATAHHSEAAHHAQQHSPHKAHGSVTSYTIGFVISIVLTAIAFFVPGSATVMIPLILITAILQVLVQLALFLHIGKGPDGETYSLMLLFTFIILFILIGGTLWIMHNLERLHHNYPATMENMYEGGVMAPEHELR